ncbi:hypothetical protein [Arthrobacter sp. CAN_C5]|uniref:hypothetical protein n=1 Tax=Arthrobacter sp. CAN_C5 TaxID=2760706 RepID=UPI001AE9CFB4|nr:hypothetical protein [Arthrobacter sp. CAN_C5]MBP2216848.1 hypothetical protein [Arthrobacter sp. CAN_C5]
MSLESDEQKWVRRQLLRKIPTEQAHLDVSRAAAVQLRKTAATSLLIAPVVLFSVSSNLFHTSGWLWWFVACVLLVGLIAVAQTVREFRSAGLFLHETEDGWALHHAHHR